MPSEMHSANCSPPRQMSARGGAVIGEHALGEGVIEMLYRALARRRRAEPGERQEMERRQQQHDEDRHAQPPEREANEPCDHVSQPSHEILW